MASRRAGVIYADTIHASPARIPAAEVPQCGVEGEVAFVFRRDLPARAAPYSREEVSRGGRRLRGDRAGYQPVSQFRCGDEPGEAGRLHQQWCVCACRAARRLARTGARQAEGDADGERRDGAGAGGGHPTGDPLGVAVVLVNMMRDRSGVRAGQFVTCGSCTGLRYLQPGDVCGVRFEGLGEAEVTFTR